MIDRAVILVAVVVLALVVVAVLERVRPRRVTMSPGITLVTGPDCRLCDLVRAGLEARGALHTTVAAGDLPPTMRVRALPTVLVADAAGAVVMRRSGRSAVTDLTAIVNADAARATGTA